MSYLLANLWGWLLAALVLGLIVGGITCSRERGNWFTGWVPLALIAFAVGVVAALLALLPGRPGFWLETALLLFASYVIGCCLGCWIKQLGGNADVADAPAGIKAAGAVAGATTVAAAAVARAPVAAAAAAPAAAKVAAAAAAPVAAFVAAPDYAGGPLTPLPEPVFSALRGMLGKVAATPAATPATPPPAAVTTGKPTGVAAPVTVATTSAAAAGGALTGLPEPVFSALRQRLPYTSVPLVPHPRADLPRPVAAPVATAAVAAPVAKAAPLAAATAMTGLPEPVASALAQRLAHTDVPVVRHSMAGSLPPVAAPVVVTTSAPSAAPVAASPIQVASTGPQATVRPVTAAASAASTGLPEPVASALRQSIPATAHVSAELGHAGVRLTGAPAEAMAQPAAVTLAHGAETVRLEAHVGAATAVSSGAAATSLHGHPGVRPKAMPIARGGKPDELLLIKGAGPRNVQILHHLGIYHFDQIAHWSPQEAQWVGSYMSFPGRIEREHWIAQCRLLSAGGDTDHARAVRSGALKRSDIGDAALSADEALALHGGLDALAPALPDEDKHEGMRPFGLAKPRGGKADDLKRVRGIGPQNEGRLHALGIWHFDQIAHWAAANVQWVGSYLAFPGRIDREEWIAQAKLLATGHDTEFSKRVDAGQVTTSRDNGSKGQAT